MVNPARRIPISIKNVNGDSVPTVDITIEAIVKRRFVFDLDDNCIEVGN
jgi:hypothetical protein